MGKLFNSDSSLLGARIISMDILDKDNEEFKELASAIFRAGFLIGKFSTCDTPQEAWNTLIEPALKRFPRFHIKSVSDWRAL